MKLTPELIAASPSLLNPIKERQLDLRGEIVLPIELKHALMLFVIRRAQNPRH